MENIHTPFTHRFLARVVLEAETPLAIGSGNKDITSDSAIAKDINNLPYIPATTIAGILRSLISDDSFFGSSAIVQNEGSKIIFSDGKIINSKGEVIDGLNMTAIDDELLKNYIYLPIRQHVRINDKGTHEQLGKFDQELVYMGTRFCFEIEMVGREGDDSAFEHIISELGNTQFRVGSGTRNGFGKVKCVSILKKTLNLRNNDELYSYLNKPSSLTKSDFWTNCELFSLNPTEEDNMDRYSLSIKPSDFFIFSSGFGDQDADMTPVKTSIVIWDGCKGKIKHNLILIPGTSVKGALSHRTAYHFNKLSKFFVGDDNAKVGNENEAIRQLFGYNENGKPVKRGNVIISDIISNLVYNEKIIKHTAIDRFTGGTIDGALYDEKTIYGDNLSFETTIYVSKGIDDKIIKSFELALKDLCTGLLPLGGGVNRGNGIFTGIIKKNGEQL